MTAKCADIIEFMGCTNWLAEKCPGYNPQTKECEDAAQLKTADQIAKRFADPNFWNRQHEGV